MGARLGRENMRCRDKLGRPDVLPDLLRGSRIPPERLLNAPRLVTSSWSDCSRLLLPLTPAYCHPFRPTDSLLKSLPPSLVPYHQDPMQPSCLALLPVVLLKLATAIV